MQRFITLCRWINVFVILATFLSYLSPYISPENYWQFSLFGLVYPWLLLLNVLFLLLWAALKKKYFFLSLGCILMGWGHLTSMIGWQGSGRLPADTGIGIMSFNVQRLSYVLAGKNESQRQNRLDEFLDWFKNESIDIFCAQELHHVELEFFDKMQLKYHYRKKNKTASIYSNFPFVEKGEVGFGKSPNAALWADVQLPNGSMIRVYSIHLQSSRIDPEVIDVVAEGKIQEKATWFNLHKMLAKFKRASAVRAWQAELVAQHIQNSPHPVLVCGDFNETPMSYAYQVISQSLNDAFRKKGQGFGTTYAGKIPALRIDYILADPRLEILDHQIIHKPYSDHYPVRSTVQVK